MMNTCHSSYVSSFQFNFRFRLEPISHKQQYFTSPTGEELITLRHDLSLRFLLRLALQQEDDISSDLEGFTFYSQTPGHLKIQARFPKSGIYRLTICAKEGDAGGSYIGAVHYIIVQMEGCKPFPMQNR